MINAPYMLGPATQEVGVSKIDLGEEKWCGRGAGVDDINDIMMINDDIQFDSTPFCAKMLLYSSSNSTQT